MQLPFEEFQRDFEERMAKLREERELRKRDFQKQKAPIQRGHGSAALKEALEKLF